jgi:hypothetical protein
MVEVRALIGAELEAHLADVAALRIAVFRDWPYLYDGTVDYEREYLKSYRDNPGALLVGAFDCGVLVGASTSTLMEDHERAFSDPLRKIGLPKGSILYGAESVLLPAYRGPQDAPDPCGVLHRGASGRSSATARDPPNQ